MKRFLELILAICMLFFLLPVTVFATNITIFNVTVDEPKVGEELSYKASVPETASTYVSKVEWNGELDGLGKIKPGKYEVRVTVRVKEGKDNTYIKIPSKDTVKVNGNSAKLRELTADKKQAVVVYTFTVTGLRKETQGQEIVNTESKLMVGTSAMVDSTSAAVLSAMEATATPSIPFIEDATELRDVISFTITEPKAGEKHDGTVKVRHPDIEITSVTWSGQVDAQGAYIVGNHYDVVVAFKIKDTVNKKLATNIKYKEVSVNGKYNSYSVSRRSDRAGYIRVQFEVQPLKPVVDITKVYTQVQADERWVTVNPMYPSEIIVNEGETLSNKFNHSNAEEWNCIKKIVLNYTYNTRKDWYGAKEEEVGFSYDAALIRHFPNLKELWLGPNVDVVDFMGDYYDGYNNSAELDIPYSGTNPETQKFTLFISDKVLPNGFSDKWNWVENPIGYDGYIRVTPGPYQRFKQRLYSGDVMAAYKKGASAGREWCTDHDYSTLLYTADRICSQHSCYSPVYFYYSCSKCGKCEYDPNHTGLVPSRWGTGLDICSTPFVTERNLSDKYFVGVNARGERVYWKSCVFCGKTYNEDLPPSEGAAWPQHALEVASLKEDFAYAFAVKADRYVTAKMSSWAENDVQWASQNGLLDVSILGNDYTKPITRLQFASVAVKLAESLTGTTISPAPKGTFTDTDSEYALKAHAAGITNGLSSNKFDPKGILTRQQMATFIYHALMYVRDNTNIRYTTYTPALEKYSDSSAIADWAKIPLGFMNALGLIEGVSDTTIDPNGKCTIEQAISVANKSINADQIGWYQVPLSTEKTVRYENYYYYAPNNLAPTQSTYTNSTRVWVANPFSGGQKATENPNYIYESVSGFLQTVDPFIGVKAWVPIEDFRPIKDLKDTDAEEYKKTYSW